MSRNDLIDYLDDNSEGDEEAPPRPARPGGGLKSWSAFYSGILIGILGAALVPHAAWLAGLLILTGYGMTAWSLGGGFGRFTRALCFGFGLSAAIGALLFLGAALKPEFTARIITEAHKRHLIHLTFLGVVAMPWVLWFVRYAYSLFRSVRPVRAT